MVKREKVKRLPPRQELFVAEYLIDRNATRAAKAAGYSKRTAESQGSRLLRNVKVAQAIAEKTEKHIAKLDKGSFDTVTRLIELASIPQQETNGTIHGQVKACGIIAEIRGEIIQKHADVTERLRGKSPDELDFIATYRRDPKDAAELGAFIASRQ